MRRMPAVPATLLSCALLVLPASSATPPAGDYVPPAEVRAALARGPSEKDLPPLAQGTWQGDVFVLPYRYGAPYDRNSGGQYNAAPRQWVARSLYAANPDTYDFILVFTNFDFDTAGALGVYGSVKNDVAGIGIDPLDASAAFGSARLQGYVDARKLAGYLDAAGEVDPSLALTVLDHEIAHRWLAHCRYKDAQGSTSTALLGLESAHWSYLLDSDASYLYGSRWRPGGDGTFTAAEVTARYSPLDLYLMGMAPKEEVPPFTLLVNPSVSAAQLPHLGDTVRAQAETVTVDQVIAAEGPRAPDAAAAPHEFTVALVYLVDPSTTTVDPQDLARLETIRTLWQASFFQQTGGRGLVRAGNFSVPPGTAASCDVPGALAWLAGRAQGDGHWEDAPATALRETAEAAAALDGRAPYQAKADAGIAALAAMTARSTELLARQARSNAVAIT